MTAWNAPVFSWSSLTHAEPQLRGLIPDQPQVHDLLDVADRALLAHRSAGEPHPAYAGSGLLSCLACPPAADGRPARWPCPPHETLRDALRVALPDPY